MQRTALFLLGFALSACARGPDAPIAPTPELPQSGSLAGVEVRTSSDGAWTVRTTATPQERRAEYLAKGEVSRVGFSGPAGGVPPGAREPSAPPPPGLVPLSGVAAPPAGAPVPAPSGSPAPGDRGDVPAKDDAPDALEAEKPLAEAKSGAVAGLRPGRSAAPLRAGSTDDNAHYEDFLAFLASWSDRPNVADRYDPIDARDRKFVRVLNAAGDPVPGAEVRLVDEAADRVAWSATTYGDGRAPFYPHVAPLEMPSPTTVSPAAAWVVPAGGYLVEVRRGDARVSRRWDGSGDELTVTLDVAHPTSSPLRLDVAFVLDTTGSMGDEIDRIKATLLEVTKRVRGLAGSVDLRYGAVLYRDLHDDYVTRLHPFTADVEAFDKALRDVSAGGGGDDPESLNQGLAEAIGRLDWRPDAAKVAFLVADAPPHMDYAGDVRYGRSLVAAVGQGIRIHAVAASGLDDFGSLVFRQIAQFTRGTFVYIEYGSPEASAASHGVKQAGPSNNLDDILFERIRDEVTGWGKR